MWEVIYAAPDLHLEHGQQIAANMASGKLAFSGDDLFFNIGTYDIDRCAQDDKSLLGKTFRISLATKNMSLISKGHRNSQGLVVTSKGELLATEHGPRGGDKLIVIAPGGNYGWPYADDTYGTGYHTNGSATNSTSGKRRRLGYGDASRRRLSPTTRHTGHVPWRFDRVKLLRRHKGGASRVLGPVDGLSSVEAKWIPKSVFR